MPLPPPAAAGAAAGAAVFPSLGRDKISKSKGKGNNNNTSPSKQVSSPSPMFPPAAGSCETSQICLGSSDSNNIINNSINSSIVGTCSGSGGGGKMEEVMGMVWIPDSEEVWRLATVEGVSGDGATLYLTDVDGECTCPYVCVSVSPFIILYKLDNLMLLLLNLFI